jgi:hypothetical protein
MDIQWNLEKGEHFDVKSGPKFTESVMQILTGQEKNLKERKFARFFAVAL